MSEYIITCDDEVAMWVGNDVESMKEIVRCRDCEEFHEFHTYAGVSLGYGECIMHRRQADGDRFCAWGERKKD